MEDTKLFAIYFNMRLVISKLMVLLAAGQFATECVAQETASNSTVPSKPTLYLSADDELKTITLPEGYRLELVLSEPDIKEPVLTVFDGNGRMYVAEMRTYMQNIDGTGEHAPSSRVSLHWSSKGNGIYDKHTVFADNLLLPRMVLPLKDGVLINETDSSDIWLYRDTNGDGVADTKDLFFAGGRRGENLEHQSSGLIWAKDNWLYQTLNAYRLRIDGTNVIKETTLPNGGQWGATQDDYGKTFFVNASGEQGPTDFQQLFIYGRIRAHDEPSEEFMQVWPLVGLSDVQGGLHRVRPSDKTLNYTTSAAGVDIYRGDRLPHELYGNMFFGEPAGRLVRRATIEVRDGITHLNNPYGHSEFIRSTDPNFRPVNFITAPDGTLYITDMYRGIIQEAAWVKPGSFMRPHVQENQLEKNFGRGRIWRLTYKGIKPGPQPRMLDQKPAQLVPYLAHPNGWWRDNAQKLIVLSGDKSVAPALAKMAGKNSDPLARIDALWALEGLNAVQPEMIRNALKDGDPHVRSAAIRISESLYKRNDHSLVDDVLSLTNDPDPNVVIQVMLTANLLQWTNSATLIRNVVATHPRSGISEVGDQLHSFDPEFLQRPKSEQKILERGATIYKSLCFACHGQNGEGAPVPGSPGATIAPPFAKSQIANDLSDGMISVILKGMKGPVNGKPYDAQMLPLENNDDSWIAAVASYIRVSFGNSSSLVRTSDVARVRTLLKEHSAPWIQAELEAAMPHSLANRDQWKLTANYNAKSASLAVDNNPKTRYDTDAMQKPGMWFQIELPEETLLAGLRLNTGPYKDDYPQKYQVEVSSNGVDWTLKVAQENGTPGSTDILFAPTSCRFIRITQLGSSDSYYWSISDLSIYTPGAISKSKTEASKFE
jgi:glucose/arabinose dehydrogenase/mono/diheme cytochrome c family protein